MRAIGFDELCSELGKHRDKRVVLTFHTIGDRDAVGSAVALSSYFPNASVVTPDFITNNARRMLSYLGISDRVTANFPEVVDLVIVLDANNTFALGRLGERLVPSLAKLIFIDHHAPHRETNMDAIAFNDETYNSTASIVYEAMKRVGADIDKTTASLLLNGIIADSAEMQNASPLTFRQVADLLEIAKVDFSFFSEYFHENIPVGNRYQVIKDVSSASVEAVGKYLLVYGRATEHANVVADAALKLEADASVFWVTSNTEASISARLRPPLDKKLSMHLGVIMEDIGRLIGGTGGGHACAAGAYGIRREAAQLAGGEAVKRIKEKLLAGE
ncbi:MAG: DHH family phosphoesterase [Candidatus Micrarchaeota archaeon]|nr:DHH family phosphoesterase [Candidatus Micrarchaeota archaeon]